MWLVKRDFYKNFAEMRFNPAVLPYWGQYGEPKPPNSLAENETLPIATMLLPLCPFEAVYFLVSYPFGIAP
jgi:hypothetical protein